jgi:hypothetical protein
MISSLLQKAGLRPGLALHSAIPKVLMAAAILGGAVSLLTVGSAKAVIIGDFNNPAQLGDLQPGNTFTNGDKILTLITLPTAGDGNIDFLSNLLIPPPGPQNDTWNIKVNFTPTAFGPNPTSSIFEYKFEIDQNISDSAFFKQVSLDTSHGGDGPIASKFVYGSLADFVGDTNLAAPYAGRIAQLTSFDGSSSQFLFPFNTYKTLWVRDVVTPGANGDITTLNNEFTQGDASLVPGPLPLMGAGMAFGFSRKLRSRIKASAKAKV